jgi:type II secretory pathway pseudopilin PulG
MRTKSKQSGLTLPELAVVIATIALLVGFGLPAIRALLNSFETQSGAKTLISAALSSARAIAAKEHRYAGVRFQQDLSGNQYMIFIVQDPAIMAYGFRAVEGVKPVKLPESVIVMDLTIVPDRNVQNPANPQEEYRIDDPSFLRTDAERDAMIDEPKEVSDITTFSIIFSPGGKLIIHGVRVRNRDGFVDSPSNTDISYDDVFNKKEQVDQKYRGFDKFDVPPGAGKFYQDDYYDAAWPGLSLGPEPSRNGFVIIYEKDKFEQALANGRAWSDYLAKTVSDRIYINSYTGTMILPD